MEGDKLVGLCLAGKVLVSLGENHGPGASGSSAAVHAWLRGASPLPAHP